MSKVFVGAWIEKQARIKLKMKCAELGIHQSDVIELLLLKWLNAKHIKETNE